ncbi:MAG: hypothetical protein JSR76_06180 [Verrucomicrobia bacterium]|nr:hypothetical protein [Verrucomicrobiota bacterium]
MFSPFGMGGMLSPLLGGSSNGSSPLGGVVDSLSNLPLVGPLVNNLANMASNLPIVGDTVKSLIGKPTPTETPAATTAPPVTAPPPAYPTDFYPPLPPLPPAPPPTTPSTLTNDQLFQLKQLNYRMGVLLSQYNCGSCMNCNSSNIFDLCMQSVNIIKTKNLY